MHNGSITQVVCVLGHFSHVQFLVAPWTVPPGFSVHGISQAGIVNRLPFPSPGDLPNLGIEAASLMSPALAGGFFTTSASWEAQHKVVHSKRR